MQLLRLEMRGFKSFAEKTTVHFSQGMSAIVGPNGSGKSNITDAIRWVLGEVNVRQLRGQRAEDIIFSGTAKRRMMSSAEVTLVFDNSDKQLSDELGEVAICRRLYRNGDSEFFINRRSCRLKDIHRLLADTGLGRDSMAIIGQNKVDTILNSKPEERRVIFEDVAGISRFKMNKEDALRRMTATERNMERVGDLIGNLKEQLVILDEKATRTRQYNEIALQKRLYDGALAYHQYKTSERLVTRLENEHIVLEEEAQELQNRIEFNRQLQLSLSKENESRQQELQEIEAAFSAAQGEIEKHRGHIALLSSQQGALERELKDKRMRLQELVSLIEEDKRKRDLLVKGLEEDRTYCIAHVEKVTILEDSYNKATEAYKAAQKAWEYGETQKDKLQNRRNELNGLREGNRAEFSIVKGQEEEKELLIAELTKEIQQVEEELKHTKALSEEAKTVYEKARKDYENLEKKEKFLQHQVSEQEMALKRLLYRKQELQGRLDIIENWTQSHEGYGEATKAIMQAKAPWRKSVYGPVGSLFTVDKRFLLALDIALGASIHNVVIGTAANAKEAIQYLKTSKRGRATFFPLDRIKGRSADRAPLKEAEIVGLASELITYEVPFKDIFTYLLGRTYIAESIEGALQVQKKFNNTLRIVTLEGELLQPGGSMTGGSFKGQKGNILSRKGEEQELRDQLKKVEREFLSLEKKLLESRNLHIALRSKKEELTNTLQRKALTFAKDEEKRRSSQERYERKVRVQKEAKADLYRLEKREVALEGSFIQYNREVEELSITLEGLLVGGTHLEHLQELQEHMQVNHEAFTKIRLEHEQLKETIKAKEIALKELGTSIEQNELKCAPLEVTIVDGEKQLDVIFPKELTCRQKELTQWISKGDALKEKRTAAYVKNKENIQAQETARLEGNDLHERQQEVQKKLIDMEGRLTKARFSGESSLQNLTALGFTKDEAQAIKVEGRVQEWQERQHTLGKEMEALGLINPNAIQEYEEALARCEFLETQQGDLQEAKNQLEKVIAEIDKSMSSQFLEVFKVVSLRFQDIFSQLFGGGQAQLTLTKKDNILESGIEMYIQPPGKKLQQLSLLSGGERALTVIALLFAFMGYRPAPFCVLDEVDAPLDEANVERFSRYLLQLCKDTQFIVVTHRKKTMEAAQVLQGVTMVEQGVSQLLTVSFDDIEEDMN